MYEYVRLINNQHDYKIKVPKVKFLHIPLDSQPSVFEGEQKYLISHVFGDSPYFLIHVNLVDTFLCFTNLVKSYKDVNVLATTYYQSYKPDFKTSLDTIFGPVLLVTNMQNNGLYDSVTVETVESFVRLYYRENKII